MHETVIYLGEVSLCIAAIYLLYKLIWARMSHFAWNRTVLLGGLAIAFALPLLEIPVGWEVGTPLVRTADPKPLKLEGGSMSEKLVAESGLELPSGAGLINVPDVASEQPGPVAASVDWWGWTFALWGIGAACMLIALGLRLFFLWRMRRTFPREMLEGQAISFLPPKMGSFSFFSWIFLDGTALNAQERSLVVQHERAHGELGHSWDILVMELAICLLWFHPLAYAWRKAMQVVHEFQADAAVARSADAIAYSKLILRLSQSLRQPIPSHAFAQSKAGQRIEMLHHSPSKPMSKLKYLFLFPLLAFLTLAVALVPAESAYLSSDADHFEFEYTFANEAIPMSTVHVGDKMAAQEEWMQAHPETAKLALKRAAQWQGTIVGILKDEGIPTDFFYLAMAESMLSNQAKSSLGAGGMWQFMPQTARECGLKVSENFDQRVDPLRTTRAAAQFLKGLHAETGSWIAAASAYNRGLPGYRKLLRTHQAQSYFQVKDKKENYLYRIMAFKRLIEEPEAFGASALPVHAAKVPRLALPLAIDKLEVTAGYGLRTDPIAKKKRHHKGVDFRADKGEPILAVADATVLAVILDDPGYGHNVILGHNGALITRYAHLAATSVKEGQIVKQGEAIGQVGSTGRSTGPHLHFEIYENGTDVDPRRYFESTDLWKQ